MSPFIVGIVSVLVGLAVCFAGYRLFRILLPLAGLVYGYAIGAALVLPDQWLLAVIVGVLVAVIIGVLAWFFWSLGVVIGGALLGAGFGWTLATAFFVPGLIPALAALVCAIAVAVLFAKLRKLGIMAVTGMGGAAAVVYGLGLMLPFLGLNQRPNLIASLAIIVLTLAGYLAQYQMHRAVDLYTDIGY